MSRAGNSAGFTLLELLVTLAISSLLVAIAVPAFPRMIESFSLRGSARDLMITLQQSRATALSRSHPSSVKLVENGGYRIDEEKPRLLPAGVTIRFLAVDIRRAGEEGPAIRFFPDGSSSGGIFELRGARDGVRIAVDWLTGRVATRD
jgi:general secretion pathway protein H